MRNRYRFLIPLALVSLLATSCGGDTEGDGGATGDYPRAETLYTGGTQVGAAEHVEPARHG